MADLATQFIKDVQVHLKDQSSKELINKQLRLVEKEIAEAENQFIQLSVAKQRAAYLRTKAIDNLDKYLIEFESNFIKKGGKLIWAQDAAEALLEIKNLVNKHNVPRVLKGKSNLFQEIELDKFLEKEKIGIIPTNLAGQLLRKTNSKAAHPEFELINKNSKTWLKDLNGTFNLNQDANTEQIVSAVKEYLRDEFLNNDLILLGADALTADSGSIVCYENEGNEWLNLAFPKTLVVIAGIDSVLTSLQDLDLFHSLHANYNKGQMQHHLVHILNGPKFNLELDGTEDLYLILLDNGRSHLLDQVDQRQALTCIQCGACSTVCPVFTKIGADQYTPVGMGPIGSILTPHIGGLEKYKHYNYTSSLCGKCTEVCPVNIKLHDLFLYNRRDEVQQKLSSKADNLVWFFWKGAMLKRTKMEKGGANLKNFMLRQFFKTSWGKQRELPKVAEKSFNQIWRERKGIR